MRNGGGGFAAFIPHSTFLPPSFGRRCPEGGGSWLSKRDEVVGSTVFPVIPLLTSFLDRKRKRFLAFARNDDAGRRHTPSFLWKEVPRRGGGAPKGRRLALEAVFSLAGMPTPPRFARLPLPEEVARMILNRASPPMYSRRCRHRTPEPEASDFTRRLLSRLCRLCTYVRVPCTYQDR